jgi:outer membrane protein TolC
MNALKIFSGLAAFSVIAGCATQSADSGFGEVNDVVRAYTGAETQWVRSDAQADSVRSEISKLLGSPLSVDDAVRIALLNNPGLQATYAELGIGEGELLSASRLPNPRFSYLNARHADEYKIESILSFNLLSLLTLPMAMETQKLRFEAIKAQVADETLRIAAETRKGYYRAIAAGELARYMENVKESAEASAELSRRMAAVGNFSKLVHMREQAFYADATAQLARTRQAALSERERLTRLMGLWGEDASRFQLPARLPDLPEAPRELDNAEQLAVEQRLDVRGARRDADALAKSLGFTRATRFLSSVELGIARVEENPAPTKRGFTLGFEIPLFDWGSGRVAGAEARYMQAVNRIVEAAVNARSEVRESYTGYRTGYDLARHYRDEVVPLRKRISEEVLLRYNGMLASVFELLSDSREQVLAVSSYIESLREFWLADAELRAAMTGRPAGGMGTASKPDAMPAAAKSGGH